MAAAASIDRDSAARGGSAGFAVGFKSLRDTSSTVLDGVLSTELSKLQVVQNVYHSDANFVLVKMINATAIYEYLKQKGIIVRNRSNVILCDDCLRITVGTPEQDRELVEALKIYQP